MLKNTKKTETTTATFNPDLWAPIPDALLENVTGGGKTGPGDDCGNAGCGVNHEALTT